MVSANEVLLQELEDELHDLCQPLTALNFRLELGKSAADEQARREAVDGALEETARLIESIKRMRERITTLKAAERSSEVTQVNHDGVQPQPQPTARVARS